MSIWDANEAFYVETPREMLERARLRQPVVQLSPAVQQAGPELLDRRGFYKVFGVSVGVQRFPIALGALSSSRAPSCWGVSPAVRR